MPWRMVVTINSPYVNGTGTNTFHGRFTDPEPSGGDDLANLAKEFYRSILGQIAQPVTLAFSGQWQGVGPDQGKIREGAGWSLASGDNVVPLPLAIAQVVTWRTSLNTRSGRGRTFLGPVAKGTLQDNGTPLESTRAQLQTAADALISGSEGLTNGALGVWSPTDQILRDFTGASVPNEYAVLRSRRD